MCSWKWPAVHAAQLESDVDVPATSPWPLPQVEWLAHAVASFVDENVVLLHAMHSASAESVAATNPYPIPHDVTDTSSHDEVDDPGLKFVPAVQSTQLESLMLVPAMKPRPEAQFSLLCTEHSFLFCHELASLQRPAGHSRHDVCPWSG